MPPVLLPLAERLGRLALRRRGFASRRVSTPHGQVHVYDAPGSGGLPPVVVLHGLGSAATPFARLLDRLRRDVRRVVAPDFPGHGFSPTASVRLTPGALLESVTAAIDALVDEPAIVVGHSLGGAVALRYALARPERVHSLVLVSPAGARATDQEWRALREAFDVGSRAEALVLLDRLYHRTPWFAPLLAHELPASFDRPAVRDLLASASNDDAPPTDALRALPMSILLLWGQSERLLPETHLQYFAASLPDHTVIERPAGFGHCPHADAPAVLAARIAEFAKGASRARSQRSLSRT
jgi:pimeloyl-ACP methyl ester carboxylesterase